MEKNLGKGVWDNIFKGTKKKQKEERDVFFNAFRTLYESAGLSFSENEDVIKASENFIKYMKPETLELISY